MADITVDQLTTQTFYQIPQIFMTTSEKRYGSDGKIKEKVRLTSKYAKELSNDAKLAYGALYNRCMLSIRSYHEGRRDFVDENGAVFLIYTVEDLMDLLDKSKPTVLKVKKELISLGLLREVKQGANRANRLYLQNVNANFQEYEYYEAHILETGRDKGKVHYIHYKTLDHMGNILFQVDGNIAGGQKSLPPTNGSKPMKNGSQKFLPPINGSKSTKNGSQKSLPREVKNFYPTNIDYSNTDNINDTNRYVQDNALSSLSTSEIFEMGEHSFLTEDTIKKLTLFGSEAKSLENKIFQAKKQVEMEYAHVLPHNEKIYGELWSDEIERELSKLIFKVKTGEQEGRPITNIPGYFYKMMLRFWKMALLIEKTQGFVEVVKQQEYAQKFPEDCPSLIAYYYPDKLSEIELHHQLSELSHERSPY